MPITYGDNTITSSGSLSISGSSTTYGLIAETTGIVRRPNVPSFSVSSHASQTGYYSGWGVIQCNNGSHFNNSNGRFTAPVAGTYYFFTTMTGLDGHQPTYPYIRKNGSTLHYGTYHMDGGGGDDQGNVTVKALVTLAVNDYIELYMDGTVNHYSDGIMFGGFLIG